MNARTERQLENVGLLLARLPIGLLFLLAGINKVRGGIRAFAESQLRSVPSWFPVPLGSAYLHCVPIFEIIVGVSLMLGLFSRIGAACATLMVISFTIAVTGVLMKGNLQPNIVFIGITLGLLLLGPGDWSIDAFIFPRRRRP